MYFKWRENAFRKAFALVLIFPVGVLSFNIQAQTEITVNKINKEKPPESDLSLCSGSQF